MSETLKCPIPDCGGDLELVDTTPAKYGGTDGEVRIYICKKCGNIQYFFSVPE